MKWPEKSATAEMYKDQNEAPLTAEAGGTGGIIGKSVYNYNSRFATYTGHCGVDGQETLYFC